MKNILLLAVALCCVTLSKAADEWKLYFSNESIEIYYTYTDCHDEANGLHQQKILYRFVNKGDANVEVSFNKEIYYNASVPVSTDAVNKIVVNKAQQVEGDCSTRNKALYTFVKQLNIKGHEVQKCELKNITIKPIE